MFVKKQWKLLIVFIFFCLFSCKNYQNDFNKIRQEKKLKIISIDDSYENIIIKVKEDTKEIFTAFYLIVLNKNKKIINIEFIPIINTSHQPITFNKFFYCEIGCRKIDSNFSNYFIVYNKKKNKFFHYQYNNKINNMIIIDNYLFYNKGKSGNGLHRIDLNTGNKKIFNVTSFGYFYKKGEKYYYQFINPNTNKNETYLITNVGLINKDLFLNKMDRIEQKYKLNEDKIENYKKILNL